MEFGFNYLPTVDHVEHYAPFWVRDLVTAEQMRLDLLTMRALGARFVRFHLFPANTMRDSLPGTDPQRSVAAMLDSMAFARSIGLKLHVDIWAERILDITREEVREVVLKTKHLVESYQIGNEPYFDWRKSDAYYDHLEALITAGKEESPGAKFSTDILAPDLRNVQQQRPRLYELLDMILIHYYATSDHRGWTPVYIEQLVDYCGGRNSQFAQLKDGRFIQSEYYPERYDFPDKEKWVTEITAAGYHKYANTMDDDTKARHWRDVCKALLERTDVTRIGHHSFRDKISWREVGQSQCGMIWTDGTPKASALAFQEVAFRSTPEDDITRHAKLELRHENGELAVTVSNSSDKSMAGVLTFYASPGAVLARSEHRVDLKPRQSVRIRTELNATNAGRQAMCHAFAAFRCDGWPGDHRTAVAWQTVRRDRPITLDITAEPFKGVKYPQGMSVVHGFFRRYPNPAIIVDGVAGFDCEMGYRLMSALRALTGKPVTLSAVSEARPLLDSPLILIGNPQTNYYARLVEAAAEKNCRVSTENRSAIAVIEKPFQYDRRASENALRIGFAYCPACLYVGGLEQADVRRATYDLIRRLWLDADVPVSSEERTIPALSGSEKRVLRLDLPPGPYRVTVVVGSDDGSQYSTAFSLSDGSTQGPFPTRHITREITFYADVASDHLLIEFSGAAGFPWAIQDLEIAHAGLLAERRHLLFAGEEQTAVNTPGTALALPAERLAVATASTMFSAERGYGWVR